MEKHVGVEFGGDEAENGNMLEKRLLITIVALLAVGSAALFLGRHRASSGVIDTGSMLSRPTRSSPLQPVEVPSERVRAAVSTIQNAPHEMDDVASKGKSTPLRVTGIVLSGGTLLPLGGVQVSLRDRLGVAHQTVETDAYGAFQLSLDPGEWALGSPYRFVMTGATGGRLFLGSAILEQEMIFIARTGVTLHGRISLIDAGEPEALVVTATVPPWGALRSWVFAGMGTCIAPGDFAISALFDRVPEIVCLSISTDSAPGLVQSIELPTEQLMTHPGPLIEIFRGDLTVVVRDDARKPVPGVSIRVATSTEPTQLAAAMESDSAGLARCFVPPGTYLLVAGKEGYRPANATFAIEARRGGASVEVNLSPLTEHDRLRGQVLTELDDPVPDALVSIYPDFGNPDASVAAMVQVLADSNGRFEAGVRCDLWTTVMAYHRDYGLSPPYRLLTGGNEVLIRIPQQGVVEVDLNTEWLAPPNRSGPVQWILVDRVRDNFLMAHDWGSPFLLTEVPFGSYNLYVYCETSQAYGELPMEVSRVSDAISVDLSEAALVKGTLIDDEGLPLAGVSVQLRDSRWPEAVRTRWGHAQTLGDGSFTILAPRPGSYSLHCSDVSPSTIEADTSTEAAHIAAIAR